MVRSRCGRNDNCPRWTEVVDGQLSLLQRIVDCYTFCTVGLWGAVNNAAMKRILDIELVSIEQLKKQAEVNFYGMVRITKAFIPMIRNSKGNCV